ncbi:cytochrome P450 [Artomyces pyxidatus]|uniref:Cytochrome P450 n=1 Tax=Artomyces pyxidatus TaxID=48021 RepID=A0ACB8T4Y7_9AGAM|nr:cytochrome P450 [Artomyces pyxidatus]
MSILSGALDLIALMAFIILFCAFEHRRKQRSLHYPPGPPRLPIIGNLLDVPKVWSWLVYQEWAKVYGDVTSMQILGQVIVVVNSYAAARDLLEKKAAIYSDRPAVPFFDLMKWSWFIVAAPYTNEWRHRRKILDRGLRPNAIVQHRPMQKQKTHDFLRRLLTRPEELRAHIEHLQGSIIMSLVYGYETQEDNDSYLKTALDANEIGQRAMIPGNAIVNDIPFLARLPEWLPGMGFKAEARVGERLGQKLVNRPFNFVKKSMRDGSARPSITRESLLELEKTDTPKSEDAERAIAEASGSLYMGKLGYFIRRMTVSAILTLFLVFVLYPEMQQRAQAEVDAVIEGQRLPDYCDRPKLPYIEALCKEVLRWRNVAPLGVPHTVTQDDVYDGCFIPKGTIVVTNIWAILHDARVYPEPDLFKPERFLTADGLLRDDPILTSVFGFGKRICPGRHLVENTLFIVAASLLATYSIGKAKDVQGKDIAVEGAYTGGSISFPVDFKCSIIPRSVAAAGLIHANS